MVKRDDKACIDPCTYACISTLSLCHFFSQLCSCLFHSFCCCWLVWCSIDPLMITRFVDAFEKIKGASTDENFLLFFERLHDVQLACVLPSSLAGNFFLTSIQTTYSDIHIIYMHAYIHIYIYICTYNENKMGR